MIEKYLAYYPKLYISNKFDVCDKPVIDLRISKLIKYLRQVIFI